MAGVGPTKVLTVTNVDATTVFNIHGNGGHRSATFWFNVTGITRTTGTLDVDLRYGAASSAELIVAIKTGITATGLNRLILTSDFDATVPQAAIPEPVWCKLTLVGDTADVAGELWTVYGD